jgi:hypothetical protein
VLHDFSGPAPRIERYFNPSLAAGGDLLLGEKGAGAASSGMNLVDNQRCPPGVCKPENVPQHTIPFNPAEIVCALVEPGAGDVTGADRKQEENDQREDRFYIHRGAFLSLFRMWFPLSGHPVMRIYPRSGRNQANFIYVPYDRSDRILIIYKYYLHILLTSRWIITYIDTGRDRCTGMNVQPRWMNAGSEDTDSNEKTGFPHGEYPV